MLAEDLIANYLQTKTFSKNDVEQICTDNELRADLCQYFYKHKNREFAIDLLNTFVARRKDHEEGLLGDHLMLACYILGLHQEVADCLLVWKAKTVDFDAFCYIDIHLMAFAGVAPTIEYLQTIDSQDAKDALERVTTCFEGGDLNDMEGYFSPENLPWWV